MASKLIEKVAPIVVSTAALLALADTAVAAEFTILIYESPKELSARGNSGAQDYWNSYNAYAGELAKAGVLRGGTALSETTASTVRGAGGADRGVAGARLGGYFIVDVADQAAAEQWARKAPAKAVAVEVRPHRPNPMMSGAPAK